MNMAEQPRIVISPPVKRRIDHLDPAEAAAVRKAIRSIGAVPGEPIDLPTARPGAPYQAQRPDLPEAPVVIYRKAQPGDPGDWLVISLMTPDEYGQQKADEQSPLLKDPLVRQEIRIAAGTAATTAVTGVDISEDFKRT